eukprot:TRINITY_DN54814_c2_g1_i1.p1 TRINITY_DN54814_c2_g1~~TRINITY_DN54814_c2_g1_i1.p1  ORF type:complete len:617 (-),score=138.68 TRINITY_DN54814_c2_g1_i1:64-1914(-)
MAAGTCPAAASADAEQHAGAPVDQQPESGGAPSGTQSSDAEDARKKKAAEDRLRIEEKEQEVCNLRELVEEHEADGISKADMPELVEELEREDARLQLLKALQFRVNVSDVREAVQRIEKARVPADELASAREELEDMEAYEKNQHSTWARDAGRRSQAAGPKCWRGEVAMCRDRDSLVQEWREASKPRRHGAIARQPRGCKEDFEGLFLEWLQARGLEDALEPATPSKEPTGWRVYKYKRETAVQSEPDWEVAYHGTWWYSLWSLLASGGVFLESTNKELGHDFWEPGVYCSPVFSTGKWYARPQVLFGDKVFHRLILELRVDPKRRKANRQRGGVQWVFPTDAVSLHAVWAQPNGAPFNGEERIYDWDPSLEAIPPGQVEAPPVVNARTGPWPTLPEDDDGAGSDLEVPAFLPAQQPVSARQPATPASWAAWTAGRPAAKRPRLCSATALPEWAPPAFPSALLPRPSSAYPVGYSHVLSAPAPPPRRVPPRRLAVPLAHRLQLQPQRPRLAAIDSAQDEGAGVLPDGVDDQEESADESQNEGAGVLPDADEDQDEPITNGHAEDSQEESDMEGSGELPPARERAFRLGSVSAAVVEALPETHPKLRGSVAATAA